MTSAHLLAPVADGEMPVPLRKERAQKREAGTFSLRYTGPGCHNSDQVACVELQRAAFNVFCSCGGLVTEREQEVQVNRWLEQLDQ